MNLESVRADNDLSRSLEEKETLHQRVRLVRRFFLYVVVAIEMVELIVVWLPSAGNEWWPVSWSGLVSSMRQYVRCSYPLPQAPARDVSLPVDELFRKFQHQSN